MDSEYSKKKKMICGKIIQDGHQFMFTGDGFRSIFCRFECEPAQVEDYLFDNRKVISLIPDKHGYVYGITSHGKGIAIYIKNKLDIYDSREVYTWNYIISRGVFAVESISETAFCFKSIRFINGAVRSIVPCGALSEDNEAERELGTNDAGCPLVYRMKNDSMTFATHIDNETESWVFGSGVNMGYSVYSGYHLTNSSSVLQIDFEDNRDLGSFYDYYGYVSTLLSFLTFRKNISVEKIELLRDQPGYGLAEFAECFVRSNSGNLEHDLCNIPESEGGKLRNFMEVLSIPMLTEESFNCIINRIVMKDKKHGDIPTLIIPLDASDVTKFSLDKIRSICTALEVEMDAANISSEPEDMLSSLINIVKERIKEYRKSTSGLSEKTYGKIFSSISHWGDSLSDRLLIAWHDNEKYLNKWLGYSGIVVSDDNLIGLVKARNDYTHRGFSEMDESLANTAYAVRGLVYVLALKRVNVKEDCIMELISRRLLG